jgi:hypothetical protein
VLALVERDGVPLRLVERLPGGAYGAWLARAPDGRE